MSRVDDILNRARPFLLRPVPEPSSSRADLVDIVANMAMPSGERAGWSPEAVRTYVRSKLPLMPTESRSDVKVKWVMDNICCAILNESFGP